MPQESAHQVGAPRCCDRLWAPLSILLKIILDELPRHDWHNLLPSTRIVTDPRNGVVRPPVARGEDFRRFISHDAERRASGLAETDGTLRTGGRS